MTQDPSKILEDATKNEITSGEDCAEETVADPKKTEQKTFDEVYVYITSGDYPLNSSKQEKKFNKKKGQKSFMYIMLNIELQSILCQLLIYFVQIIDGVLHYISKEGPRQVIGDTSMKKKIVESCHNERLGGCHFGCDKTAAKALLLERDESRYQ